MINFDKSVIVEINENVFDFGYICYDSNFIPDFITKFILTINHSKIVKGIRPLTTEQAYEVIKIPEYILNKKFIETKR